MMLAILPLAIFICCAAYTASQSVESKILSDIAQDITSAPCLRIVASTGPGYGCDTSPAGAQGVLRWVGSEAASFAQHVPSDPNSAVAVLPYSALSKAMLQQLYSTGKLAGVMVLQEPVAEFQGSAPQPLGSTGAAHVWAAHGRDIIRQRWPFPVVLVEGEQAARVKAHAMANGEGTAWPQHAARLWYPQGPADFTSVQCMAQGECLPLGGQSIWGTAGPLVANATSRAPSHADGWVMLAAPMDTANMFAGQGVGANTAASSIAAVLAAFDAVMRVDEQTKGRGAAVAALPRGVALALFNGEAWDSMGSARFVEDIAGGFRCKHGVPANQSLSGQGACRSPARSDLTFQDLPLSSIRAVFAVDQVGAPSHHALVAHTASVNSNATAGQELAALLQAVQPGLVAGSVSAAAPPTPASAFGRRLPRGAAALIARYDRNFTAPYYDTEADSAGTVSAAAVAEAATLLARAAWAAATGAATPADAAAAVPSGLAANVSFVQEVLHCLTVTHQCDLFARTFFTPATQFPAQLQAAYVGLLQQPRWTGSSLGFTTDFRALALRGVVADLTTANVTSQWGKPALRYDSHCTNGTHCAHTYGPEYSCVLHKCATTNEHWHLAASLALQWEHLTVNTSAVDAGVSLFAQPYYSESIGAQLIMLGEAGWPLGQLLAGLVLSAGAWWLTARFQQYCTTHFHLE